MSDEGARAGDAEVEGVPDLAISDRMREERDRMDWKTLDRAKAPAFWAASPSRRALEFPWELILERPATDGRKGNSSTFRT